MKYYQPVFFRRITDSFPEIQEAAYYLRQMLDNAVISEAPSSRPPCQPLAGLPACCTARRFLCADVTLVVKRRTQTHTVSGSATPTHADTHTHIIAEVHTHICRYRNRDTYTQIQTQIHTRV